MSEEIKEEEKKKEVKDAVTEPTAPIERETLASNQVKQPLTAEEVKQNRARLQLETEEKRRKITDGQKQAQRLKNEAI